MEYNVKLLKLNNILDYKLEIRCQLVQEDVKEQ